MNLKPYFYYWQQYQRLNNSDAVNIDAKETDSKEVTSGANSLNEALDVAAAEKKAGGLLSKDQEKELEPKYEHSRFLEVAPGVFQFKHTRPNMVQNTQAPMVNRYIPGFLACPSQSDKKPGADKFVKIGVFPTPSGSGLPVYQFT